MLALKIDLWANAVSLGGKANEAETTALLARMTVPPSPSRVTAINALIAGLKADGIWSKLSGLYDLAAETEQQALLNWVESVSGTNTGCTFTANAGVTHPGSGSSFIDLGLAFGVYGDTVNDVTAGVWCNAETGVGASNYTQFGTTGASGGGFWITAARASFSESYRLHDNATTALTSATRTGHRCAVRSGTTKSAYRDGNTMAVSTATISSVGLNNGNAALFRTNATYSAVADRLCFAYLGSAFGTTDVANMHSRLSAYKTAASIS